MTWEWAWLDDIDGFSKAHLERLPDGRQIIVGTFKGLRTFHDERKGTAARMTFQGVIEEGEKAYRVTAPVEVQITDKNAKFKSVGTILEWEQIEND